VWGDAADELPETCFLPGRALHADQGLKRFEKPWHSGALNVIKFKHRFPGRDE
jgi:hypothetical protein